MDRKFCSNGFFVGVDKVYDPNKYSSILGSLLFNPEYTIMADAIQHTSNLKGGYFNDPFLVSKDNKFSVFGVKNNQFVDVPDPNHPNRRITIIDASTSGDFSQYQMQVTGDPIESNNRLYPEDINNPVDTDVFYAQNTINTIVLNQIIEDQIVLNSENYYRTKEGDFVKTFPDGSIAGGGDLLVNKKVTITSSRETDNGTFYEVDKPFQHSIDDVYKSLVSNADKFSKFVEILEAIDGFVDITEDDKRLKYNLKPKECTLLIPNNTAVQQAITDGVIVDPANLPTDAEELDNAKKKLLNFAKLHIMQNTILSDQVSSLTSKSLYSARSIDFSPIYKAFAIEAGLNKLIVKDADTGESIATSGGVTNLFSKKIIIHELDGYLKY